jgi:nicotinate-nucleotide adenylyltransferase
VKEHLLTKRVGIYAGTFDPIHAGHVGFAGQAIKQAGLSKVFFLPEPSPRRKQGVHALEHREAMVRLAVAEDPKLGIIKLHQANFTPSETLPKLNALFEGAELYMLMGDDVFVHLNEWPHVKKLLTACKFIIGIRKEDETKAKQRLHAIEEARNIKLDVQFLISDYQDISSSKIRSALNHGKPTKGLLPQTFDYIKANKLYLNHLSQDYGGESEEGNKA